MQCKCTGAHSFITYFKFTDNNVTSAVTTRIDTACRVDHAKPVADGISNGFANSAINGSVKADAMTMDVKSSEDDNAIYFHHQFINSKWHKM